MKILCLLLFTLLSFESIADSIQTLQLQHRSADSLLPILMPMLDESSAISGSGYKIFLRASPQQVSSIRKLVKQLDVPLKQLMISVFHGTQREKEELSSEFTVIYRHNNAGSRNIGFALSTRNEQTVTTDFPVYQLKILEGYSGYIETGQTIPELYQRTWINRRGQVILETEIDHRESFTGFNVSPRMHGDEVTLEISPYKTLTGNNQFQSGAIETESLSTTLTGRLGQWLEIAGQQTEISTNKVQSGIRHQTREQESSHVWVRADLIHRVNN